MSHYAVTATMPRVHFRFNTIALLAQNCTEEILFLDRHSCWICKPIYVPKIQDYYIKSVVNRLSGFLTVHNSGTYTASVTTGTVPNDTPTTHFERLLSINSAISYSSIVITIEHIHRSGSCCFRSLYYLYPPPTE